MKKLFGGINLTWKKLIIFAVVTGLYTAIMALLPITRDTSFRDIAVYFEWWILFGIIIICNSKSPLDSALKCFVFFLISQPLIYLIQVPFSNLGWGLFDYYKYWFYWTLACFPMGYIGYYIKKKNWLSVLILSPMIVLLTYLGFNYINMTINNFPYHILSGISCFLIIIVVVHYLFDKKHLKYISLGVAIISLIVLIFIRGGIGDDKFETYKNIDGFDIKLEGRIKITEFTAQDREGNVEILDTERDIHTVKVSGWKTGEYTFTITDEKSNEYTFQYYFDDEQKTVVLEIKE